MEEEFTFLNKRVKVDMMPAWVTGGFLRSYLMVNMCLTVIVMEMVEISHHKVKHASFSSILIRKHLKISKHFVNT